MNDPADRRPFAEAMQALCAAFRVECSKPLQYGYWLALQMLTIDEVRGAIEKALPNSEFMPSAAELRRIARPRPPARPPWYIPATSAPAPWPQLEAVKGDD